MSKTHFIKSTAIVSGFTALSRVLGLVRDMLMAGVFGTSLYVSAFVVAFTIPNLFRRLFGEGALSASFIPVFIEVRHKEGEGPAWIMVRKVVTLLTLTLLAIVIAAMLVVTAASLWMDLGEKAALVMPLLRIMLPYTVFICLAALSMAILNSYHHYAVPAFTPCLLNFVWIVAVLFAFVTNRLFVFRSKNHWGLELLAFVSSRIATLVVFEIGLFAAGILVMERVFHVDREAVLFVFVGFTVTYKYIVKILIAVFVVVSNYILSKWFIFRKNKSACVVSQGSAEGEE